MNYARKLDTPQKVNLSDIDPSDTGKADKGKADKELNALGAELSTLQEWLYAAGTHSVLVVLQGLDTSGKDGTISHVLTHVNPQGCDVASFKVPTAQELSHDFLWRVHPHAPAKGQMCIFNRSHYEDVLVTRVHNTIDANTCEARYAHIRQFEQLLVDANTIVVKFMLHISKDEQKARLLAREQDPEKAWKLSTGDWEERQFWDAYTSAYQDALSATAARHAPWYVVPANHKWYRNLAVASVLVETLRPYKDDWQETLHKMGEERKAELAAMRASDGKAPETPDTQPAKTH